MNLTLKQYIDIVTSGKDTARHIVSHYLTKAKQENSRYNAFLTFADEYIENNIDTLANKPLAGAPIALKDLINTQWVRTTFGSKIAEKFVPSYSATCFANLENAGGCLLGKANLDEFAMGGSNENSAYGPVLNPYGDNRISGGSSGGSAAAVAADLCIAAIGTDTWWSVRQPANLCGIVGLKPTYGRVSRYGVQAMASSFDQVWTMTKTVKDAVILLDAISGHDTKDATSSQRNDTASRYNAIQMSEQALGIDTSAIPTTDSMSTATNLLAGKKIGYFKEFFGEGIDPLIAEQTKQVLARAEQHGAEVIPFDFPLLKYMVAVYYVLMPAEVSTNMARFDGIRYWLQDDTAAFASIKDYYDTIRDKWFGTEVKRRILTGSFVLSAGFYDAYYRKAQAVRAKMQQAMATIFADVDVILGPTSPEFAWKIGERTNDPIKNYLADIYTIPANIWWYPAINIPTGFVQNNNETFACGVQLMANHWKEDTLFSIGNIIQHSFILR